MQLWNIDSDIEHTKPQMAEYMQFAWTRPTLQLTQVYEKRAPWGNKKVFEELAGKHMQILSLDGSFQRAVIETSLEQG